MFTNKNFLTPPTGVSLIDHLYNLRQDGQLDDFTLAQLAHFDYISQWTYERLLALKPEPTKED